MFMAALVTIMSMKKINKYVHIVEHYSAIKE